MAVYVDSMAPCPTSPRWRWPMSCHMFADDLGELHKLAQSIGLKRSWFQTRNHRLLHYDLTSSMRKKAVKAGAIEVNYRHVVQFMREGRINVAPIPSLFDQH